MTEVQRWTLHFRWISGTRVDRSTWNAKRHDFCKVNCHEHPALSKRCSATFVKSLLPEIGSPCRLSPSPYPWFMKVILCFNWSARICWAVLLHLLFFFPANLFSNKTGERVLNLPFLLTQTLIAAAAKKTCYCCKVSMTRYTNCTYGARAPDFLSAHAARNHLRGFKFRQAGFLSLILAISRNQFASLTATEWLRNKGLPNVK